MSIFASTGRPFSGSAFPGRNTAPPSGTASTVRPYRQYHHPWMSRCGFRRIRRVEPVLCRQQPTTFGCGPTMVPAPAPNRQDRIEDRRDLEGRGDGVEVGTCSGEERSPVSPLRFSMLRTRQTAVSTSLHSKGVRRAGVRVAARHRPGCVLLPGPCVYPRVGAGRCSDGPCQHPAQGCICVAATAPPRAGHFFVGRPRLHRDSFSSCHRAGHVSPRASPVETRDQRGKLGAGVRCSRIGHRVARLRANMVDGDSFT